MDIYNVGYFKETVTYVGGTMISNGDKDIFVSKNDSNGNIVVVEDCDGTSGDTYYCGVSTTPREIFNTTGTGVNEGSVEFAVGSSPDAENATGVYSDELKFIATATF